METLAAVATLSNLRSSLGTLSPSFSSNVFDYTVTVPTDNSSIQITAVSADSGASITVNGVSVVSNVNSNPISLAFGSISVNVTVIAQNGINTNTYRMNIVRPLCNILVIDFD